MGFQAHQSSSSDTVKRIIVLRLHLMWIMSMVWESMSDVSERIQSMTGSSSDSHTTQYVVQQVEQCFVQSFLRHMEADVVIGVPDSGLDAALGYSQESGIPYGIGFIKNKYIGRTFIQGSQKQRENSVRIKLNVVSSTVKGKRVVLVDDSIVRGTTSARIIKLLRDAGAAEVHFMVSAPPFKYPCYFGTDIPDQKLLVATGRTLEQINEVIGADTLGYLSNEHVVQLAKNAKCGFCTACFTGEYAVEPESVLSTDIHDRHLNDRPKDAKKLGE